MCHFLPGKDTTMSPYSSFSVASCAKPVRVCIIGHHGRMGRMFTTLWQQAGHSVVGIDRNAESTEDPHINLLQVNIDTQALAAAVIGADVVMLCVPTNALPDVLAVLVPLLQPHQVLADVCSVKTVPLAAMCAAHTGPVVGTHPLFGPVATKKDLVVAVTPGEGTDEAAVELVEALFTGIGCRVFRTTAAEHDRGVGFAQALNFASNAIYFATVADQLPGIMPFITHSFRRRIEADRKQMTEDANMFIGFIKANPEMGYALEAMRNVLDAVEGGNLEPVVRRAQHWFGPKGER